MILRPGLCIVLSQEHPLGSGVKFILLLVYDAIAKGKAHFN
jgi:hypothetical protein